MWASRRSSLLRPDISSWSLGESLWERSRQFLLLLGRALCLAVVLQGGLPGQPLSPCRRETSWLWNPT